MTEMTGIEQPEPTLTQLEQEGDVAADYIEELLDICDLDGDMDIEVRNGRAYVAITSSDTDEGNEGPSVELLSKPETVSALQELARLSVQTKLGVFSRLILDIAGSRDQRRNELAKLVERAVQLVDSGAAEAALPPMSSYERKLVHDLVAEHGFDSSSRGEGRDRHTVITKRA